MSAADPSEAIAGVEQKAPDAGAAPAASEVGQASHVSSDSQVDIETELQQPSEGSPDPVAVRGALEALLFVADGPLEVPQLAAAVQRPVAEVTELLAAIAAELDGRRAGWQLRPAATGIRLYTRDEYAPVVEGFLLEGQRSKLSQAALETLAVIAYRQPVTRARISAIRGVNVDGVVRTLLTRELITEDGTDPVTGGGLYRTTPTFLEKMGIQSVDELPSLAPLLPELDSLDADEL
ncbi:MAG TPA: SMC-Scp complex subunit ScpB [Jatrophihabitans sp.]|nr:SMC-Scp complex subunit ScpB [Jatrophihabitans sp.]